MFSPTSEITQASQRTSARVPVSSARAHDAAQVRQTFPGFHTSSPRPVTATDPQSGEKHSLSTHSVIRMNLDFLSLAATCAAVLDFDEAPRLDVTPLTQSPPRYKLLKEVDGYGGQVIKLESSTCCGRRRAAVRKAEEERVRRDDAAKQAADDAEEEELLASAEKTREKLTRNHQRKKERARQARAGRPVQLMPAREMLARSASPPPCESDSEDDGDESGSDADEIKTARSDLHCNVLNYICNGAGQPAVNDPEVFFKKFLENQKEGYRKLIEYLALNGIDVTEIKVRSLWSRLFQKYKVLRQKVSTTGGEDGDNPITERETLYMQTPQYQMIDLVAQAHDAVAPPATYNEKGARRRNSDEIEELSQTGAEARRNKRARAVTRAEQIAEQQAERIARETESDAAMQAQMATLTDIMRQRVDNEESARVRAEQRDAARRYLEQPVQHQDPVRVEKALALLYAF